MEETVIQWRWEWTDMLMAAAGGFALGLAVGWQLWRSRRP